MWKRLWHAWKKIAHQIGNFQARVLLTVFYALLLFPFGITARLFFDPLRIKKPPTNWLDHPDDVCDLKWAQRQ
jgi:hypothetical protein